MLPASTSIRSGAETEGVGFGRPAKNLSTIAAISSRPILAAGLAPIDVGAGAGGRGALVVVEVTAGRALLTGLVSKATRLISIKCNGETLSEVTLPPHDPQPRVIDGGNAVEKPIAP